jgi:hypothetical protein
VVAVVVAIFLFTAVVCLRVRCVCTCVHVCMCVSVLFTEAVDSRFSWNEQQIKSLKQVADHIFLSTGSTVG